MQTILGAGGVIANNLARELVKFTGQVKLVSRHPKKVNNTDQLQTADLLDGPSVSAAVKGADIVYLTAGLKYDVVTWQAQWPLIMQNVIDACKEHRSKLVFFDNVYAYGKVEGWMVEDSPYNPCSKKGEIRALIARQLMEEARAGNLEAQIVRAADFYGPATPQSFISVMVMDKLAKGKKAQLLLSDDKKHSLTYTPDAGRATALLGNTPSAYHQVWHAPTAAPALTGKEFVALAAKAMGVPARYQVMKKWMLSMAGLFVPVIRETREMLYQNAYDYLFSSAKFEKAFPDFRVTPYEEGLAACAHDPK